MLKVIVIGGVAGGMSAAAKLKRNLRERVDITVFEKGDEVSYAACGIPYFVGGKIKDSSSLLERSVEQFAESGIAVKLGHEVTKVDLGAKQVIGRVAGSGEPFARKYDKLIVASGAKPRMIPPLDVRRDNLFVVRDVGDGVRLKGELLRDDVKNVVVVGAGYIGLEIAEACARRGKNVFLVEFAGRILPVMDAEITDQLTLELKKHGVAVKTGSKVVGLDCDGDRIRSAIVEGVDGNCTVPADLVVNCAGIIPETGFVDVRKAGNGAIIVNERMETSAPDVYAAGDCSIMTSALTGEHIYAPLGTNANKQGRIIAELLAGKPVPPFKLVGASAIKLFDVDAAKVGLSETDAQRLNLNYKTNRITGNSYASYYSGEKVTIKLVYDAGSRRILGAQAFGQGVVAARANYFAIAIHAGMTVDEFGFLDLCYSPPFSGVWDVTMIAANTAK